MMTPPKFTDFPLLIEKYKTLPMRAKTKIRRAFLAYFELSETIVPLYG
ncbi:MAG: hypothetical protein R2822_22545 [Spirosomataceae bacterium]